VEDDVAAARLLQKRLERAGYVVDIAHDGKEGLAMYAAGSYDVVIVDQNMPVRDGLEVIRLMASQGPLPPMIMVTGAGDEKTAVEAMKLGVGDYIVKDVDGGYLELLPTAIERVLHQERLVEEKQQAEAALRESEELYSSIFESMSDGVLVLDRDFRYIHWNRAMERISKVPREEVINNEKVAWEIFPHLAEQGMDEMMRRAMQGEVVEREDIPYRLHDGTRGFTSEIFLPLRTASGEIRGIVGMVRDTTGRKRAEAALRESEEKYRNLVERANDGIVIVQDKLIKYANPRSAEIVGYPVEELTGTLFTDHVHPEELPRVVDSYQRRMAGEDVTPTYETVFRHRDGSKIYAEINAGIITYRGKPADLVVIRDITGRRRVEEALRASEERFALAVRGSNDGIWDWDIENDSLYWSPRLKELLGYADDELDVDFEVFDAHLHPEDKERMGAAIEAHLKDRGPYDVEQRLRTKSGEYGWFRARGQALWDEAGNPLRMVGSTTDITARKRGEEALRESEERFRTIVETAPSLLLITDAKGNNVYVSPNCEEITGYTQEELQGQVVWWVHEDDTPRAKEVYDRTFGKGVGYKDLEYKAVKKNGELWYGSSSWEPFRDAEGRLQGFVFQTTDVTERKRTEEYLQRRNMELATLNALAQALSSTLELQDLLDETLSRTVHTLGFTGGLIGLADERVSELVLSSYMGLPLSLVEHLKAQGLSDTLCDFVYRESKVLCLEDLREGAPVDVGGLLEVGLQSYVGAPIVHKERSLGTLCLFDAASHAVSETDYDLLTAIGQQIGIAVENARLYEQTRVRLREATLLHGVTAALSSTLDIEQVLPDVARSLCEALNGTSAEIYSLNEEANTFTIVAEYGIPESIEVEMPDSMGQTYALADFPATVEALAQRRPMQVRVDDLETDPRERAELETYGGQAMLLLPMVAHDQVVGFAEVWESRSPRRFTEGEVNLGQTLANQAASALENAHLFEETRHRVRELRLLHDVGLAAASGVRLEETLQTAAEALAAELEGPHVALMLLDPESDTLRVEAIGGYPDDVKDLRLRLGEGITGWVAQHGEPLLVPDVRLDPRYFEGHSDTRSELCVPLALGRQVIGVLNVESHQPDAFTEDDQRLLSTLANNLAVLIERARLFEEVELARGELQQRAKALEEANVRLQELDRLKSEFLANMSHEIRTPLNAVIGMTGLLLDTELNAEQQDYAETVRSSGEALLSLINDILDFSKIEAGKLELETQPFDLRGCIEESLDLLASKAAEKGLDLAYLIDDQVPHTVVGDVTRLRQILVNLLSNAVKFTEEGEVVVSVASRPLPPLSSPPAEGTGVSSPPMGGKEGGHELQFAVRDTGIGIPEERMDRLFQSFSQVDASTTRKYGGTGLGLTISKRLTEMMGGTMWVESPSAPLRTGQVGQGSTFYFTVLAEAVPAQKRVYLHEPEPELMGKRVLIVDDNATNRRILIKQAESWGMLPRAAASGLEALEWICQGDPFDVAVLDMHMPEMDGLTLAAEIRQHRDSQALPLVMLASVGRREEGSQTVEFAAYLTKPVKTSQLYDVLVGVFAGRPIRFREPAARPQFDPQMGRRHPLRILLAEDNVVNQKVALRILERLGYRADVAANGLEVLEALERQSYDLVLMDVQMPEMDGVEATCRICEQWPDERRPRIIAMTAHAMEGDRERYLEVGMDDYISKPVRVEELMKALGKCSSNQRISESVNQRSTATGSSAGEAIDAAVLEQFQTVMGEAASELMGLFLEDTPNLLADLREAVAQVDGEGLQRAAHTLKSSSASLGAMTLSVLCQELEGMGRAGALEGAAEKVAGVEAEYERVKDVLEKQMASTERTVAAV
jgi:PAS domain S-box-containing protein